MPIIISISERPEDLIFVESIANKAGLKFAHASRAIDLRKILKDNKDAVLFWDVDHPHAIEVTHPLSISNVSQVLNTMAIPDKVFVISEQPLNTTPYIFNVPYFSHHLYRQYKDPTAELVGFLAKACGSQDPFGLDRYMAPGAFVKKIVLKNSGQRKAVVAGMSHLLQKSGSPPQLIQMATQTTDEILMNAIFDAPVEGNNRYRRQVARNKDFDLSEKETVHLEIAVGTGYLAICARDHFGSLKKDSVLNFIRKNYEKQDYKVKEDDPGAGLGIYGILQSGLSLLFCSRPNIKTEVTLFIPIVKTMKSFRTSFRFFSFI